MFFLSTLEESIRLEPKDLDKPRADAISLVIEELFVDKIVQDLGLVVTLYDIVSIASGFVHHSDGGPRFQVVFRVVVFRPFAGEVIVGKIKRVSRAGLHVSLGFFDDVIIPEHYLQEESMFDEAEQLWFWKYVGEDGQENKLYMELDEDIRFKSKAVRFQAIPTPEELRKAREKDPLIGTAEKPLALMEVIGEVYSEGLGPVAWWMDDDEENEQMPS
ncbi:unnamed protein product [Ostreobium quekettii]|uniref:DNA-directed RNA polymerase III subunit RPC8 n=1 Tax=Ostreobium quekettii TaxID=121088 RepID=A0A8S1JBB1_9CHLO|nr:unnamed protein product [Ostreobium quekettii]|eukprot:evm.model.scf_126.8 EVM.evm.TU.scf_126.8   scf_126:120946-125106(-)